MPKVILDSSTVYVVCVKIIADKYPSNTSTNVESIWTRRIDADRQWRKLDLAMEKTGLKYRVYILTKELSS